MHTVFAVVWKCNLAGVTKNERNMLKFKIVGLGLI